jgi:hypothetical protein
MCSKRHASAGRVERAGLLRYLLFFIEHLERPARRGNTGCSMLAIRSELRQRLGEHSGVLDECLYVTEVHGAAGTRRPPTTAIAT